MGISKLNALDVYQHSNLKNLSAKSTKDIAPIDEIVGQERAQKAVEFAMSIKEKGYNIYAIGRNGLGKRTMILRYLKRHPHQNGELSDWCYVANFEDIRTPKVLRLPSGVGASLKVDCEKLMEKLLKAMPLAFDNEMYFSRSEQLKNQLANKQAAELEKMTAQAKEKSISLTITPQGDYQFVALDGEEQHTEESFDQLPKKEQAQFDKNIDELESMLREMVRMFTDWEEDYASKIKRLNNQRADQVVGHLVEDLIEKYDEHNDVKTFLKALRADIIENVDIFLEEGNDQADIAGASLDKRLPRRYKINVLVSQTKTELPVIVEESPNYHSLFGYIETATFKGTVFTDFSLIRPGSLHRANGGVLLMDAVKVLEQPYVWEGLKRALRSRSLSLTSLEKEVTLTGTVSLDPEPIPLDIKIILFGDYRTYQLLQQYDPEFAELFRVTADFEDEMDRDESSEMHYARFISSIVHDNNLLHCDIKAIERIIEHSARRSGSQGKLSLHSAHIANLLRETNYVAKASNANRIVATHVEQALANQESRVSRLQEGVMESFVNGTTLMRTEGTAVGQVNALSVLSTIDHMFGAPNRITATTAYGDGEVIDIERNVDLGGSIHSKGVMILSAYLRTVFGKTARVPLTTNITFEQSYGGVDGDSASMAEFCAVVSAFAKREVRQDLAITGSMNQFGEAQPIGGVNEKIEGFFDVCAIKGRNGKQGVIIPRSNVQNLMLRSDIVAAIEKGSFTIYAIDRVEEAVELFMGAEAGVASDEGSYPIDTVYGVAQAKLNSLRK